VPALQQADTSQSPEPPEQLGAQTVPGVQLAKFVQAEAHLPLSQQLPLHAEAEQVVLHLPALHAWPCGQSSAVAQPQTPATHVPPFTLLAQSAAPLQPHVVPDRHTGPVLEVAQSIHAVPLPHTALVAAFVVHNPLAWQQPLAQGVAALHVGMHELLVSAAPV